MCFIIEEESFYKNMLLKADNTLINILVSSNQKENNKDNISEPQPITNTLFCNNFPCLITFFYSPSQTILPSLCHLKQ